MIPGSHAYDPIQAERGFEKLTEMLRDTLHSELRTAL
jgi:hypothetical protein